MAFLFGVKLTGGPLRVGGLGRSATERLGPRSYVKLTPNPQTYRAYCYLYETYLDISSISVTGISDEHPSGGDPRGTSLVTAQGGDGWRKAAGTEYLTQCYMAACQTIVGLRVPFWGSRPP